MVTRLNGIQRCQDLAQFHRTGCFTVKNEGITWQVFVSQGKLLYANHSAQTLETLNYHLGHLGYEIQSHLPANAPGLEISPWGILHQASETLYRRGSLNREGLDNLKRALCEDALESLLWLTQGSESWVDATPDPATAETSPSLADVLAHLLKRLSAWQQLMPIITSPYQQPYCPDANRLSQSVPNGKLQPMLLSMLVKLMHNSSIRQLSLGLKQDSLKVAQLLHPYIQHGVLQLHPPAPAVSQLPSIPTAGISPGTSTAVQPLSAGRSPAGASLGLRKIVCIDDSPAMLETLQHYLGAEGFEVSTVENPMQSLGTLCSMKPDLILMDVSMPGINGNRLCQILRRSSAFKTLPIIMVSGNSGALDKAKSEASGATDYLTKPFSKEELLARIEPYLTAAAPT